MRHQLPESRCPRRRSPRTRRRRGIAPARPWPGAIRRLDGLPSTCWPARTSGAWPGTTACARCAANRMRWASCDAFRAPREWSARNKKGRGAPRDATSSAYAPQRGYGQPGAASAQYRPARLTPRAFRPSALALGPDGPRLARSNPVAARCLGISGVILMRRSLRRVSAIVQLTLTRARRLKSLDCIRVGGFTVAVPAVLCHHWPPRPLSLGSRDGRRVRTAGGLHLHTTAAGMKDRGLSQHEGSSTSAGGVAIREVACRDG